MTFDKDRSAGYLVNHMARLFAGALQERIVPLGLSTGTFPVLLVLWEEEGLTQRDLVARLDIEQATMANTLIRMERDGLITRKKDPSDGRAQRVWLTREARKLRETATQAASEVNDMALATLTEPERQIFLELVARVITRLGEGDRS